MKSRGNRGTIIRIWQFLGVLTTIIVMMVGTTQLTLDAAVPRDVEDHWAARDVTLLLELGIFERTQEDTFRPNDAIRRGEALPVLLRAFGFVGDISRWEDEEFDGFADDFSDVGPEDDLYPFVRVGIDLGIASGYPDGEFKADVTLSRAEVVAFLHRLLEQPDVDAFSSNYVDADMLPDWAEDAIDWASKMGFMRGFPDGHFQPQAGMTRAEVATLVRRVMEAQGRLFTAEGDVEAHSVDGRAVTLRLKQGDSIRLNLAGVPIYDGHLPIAPKDIGVGDALRVRLDDQGEVKWVERDRRTLTGILESVDADAKRLDVRPIGIDEPTVGFTAWAEAAFAAAGDPTFDLSLSESSYSFHWDEDLSTFQRNGLSSGATDLRSGDRVYITLDGKGPFIRYLHAVQYDSSGRLTEVDHQANRLQWIRADGVTETATITPDSRFDLNGMWVRPARLREGMRIGVARDGEAGAIAYAEVFRPSELEPIHGAEYANDSFVDETPAGLSQNEISNVDWLEAPRFRNQFGLTGAGIRVAVIDTGVDPGLADLWGASGARLAAFRDFTGIGNIGQRGRGVWGTRPAEGDVLVDDEVALEGRRFRFEDRIYTITGPQPVGETVKVGWLPDAMLTDDEAPIPVVLVATTTAGDYDAVYVDLDRNRVLTDDEFFQAGTDSSSIGMLQNGVHFVVTEIDGGGSAVNIGFDGNGHGTQVAGIIAGGDHEYTGMAPGVELLVLKAMTSEGKGSWTNVLEAARHAAIQGADIINISLTGLPDPGDWPTRQAKGLQDIAEDFDVLIVTAAGNEGPGLGSVFTPGVADETLSVGGVLPPPIVRRESGYQLPHPVIWEHSSIGPRADGGLSPQLLAPAVTRSLIPNHLAGSGVATFRGTSCAAAYVSGAAALLKEAANAFGLAPKMSDIGRAFREGAEPLPNYSSVEQGYGVINLWQAWEYLETADDRLKPVKVEIHPSALAEMPQMAPYAEGVYLRSWAPSMLKFSLVNPNDVPVRVTLDTVNLPSATLQAEELVIPSEGNREISVRYNAGSDGQLESGFLTVDNRERPGVDARILHTILHPIRLDDVEGVFEQHHQVGPGEWNRYFVKVPEGASRLDAQLSIPTEGRVRMRLTDPKGHVAFQSAFIGAGTHQMSGDPVKNVGRRVDYPESGVWEIMVSSPTSLSFFGLSVSDYALMVSLIEDDSARLHLSEDVLRFQEPGRPERVPIDLEVSAQQLDLEDYPMFGVGWLDQPSDLAIIPRRSVSARLQAPHQQSFSLLSALDYLQIWTGNVSSENAGPVSITLYQKQDGTRRQVATGVDLLEVNHLSKGDYQVVSEPRTRQQKSYDLMALGWSENNYVLLDSSAEQSDGRKIFQTQVPSPEHAGTHWMFFGLKDPEGRVVMHRWLRADCGQTPHVLLIETGVSQLMVNVRERDSLRRVERGTLVVNERDVYSVGADGMARIGLKAPSSSIERMRIYHHDTLGEKDSASAIFQMPIFSSNDHATFWRDLKPMLQREAWRDPLAEQRFRRWFARSIGAW